MGANKAQGMGYRILLLAVASTLVGCVGEMPRGTNSPTALASALMSLSPSVNARDARRAADCAYTTSARLKHEYRIVGPAVFQNGLINLGFRKKGFCYHYTEDLLADMQRLDLRTLQIHWAIAHPGTYFESNALVLTAPGQPLEEGIVLDPWRHAGKLYWNKAAADRAFGWHEDHSEYARERLSRTAKAMRKAHAPIVATSR